MEKNINTDKQIEFANEFKGLVTEFFHKNGINPVEANVIIALGCGKLFSHQAEVEVLKDIKSGKVSNLTDAEVMFKKNMALPYYAVLKTMSEHNSELKKDSMSHIGKFLKSQGVEFSESELIQNMQASKNHMQKFRETFVNNHQKIDTALDKAMSRIGSEDKAIQQQANTNETSLRNNIENAKSNQLQHEAPVKAMATAASVGKKTGPELE